MAQVTSQSQLFLGLDKRRQCKFINEWTLKSNFSTWLLPVEQDPHKAFCRVCRKVFPVSHGGLHDVKAHAKGKRHLLLSQQYFHENFLNQFQGPRAEWNYLARVCTICILRISFCPTLTFKPLLHHNRVWKYCIAYSECIATTTCGSMHLRFLVTPYFILLFIFTLSLI